VRGQGLLVLIAAANATAVQSTTLITVPTCCVPAHRPSPAPTWRDAWLLLYGASCRTGCRKDRTPCSMLLSE
jgi:hypothetical protein